MINAELDALIAGFIGGAIASFAFMAVIVGHVKYVFHDRMKQFQIQLIALRAELNSSYSDDK